MQHVILRKFCIDFLVLKFGMFLRTFYCYRRLGWHMWGRPRKFSEPTRLVLEAKGINTIFRGARKFTRLLLNRVICLFICPRERKVPLSYNGKDVLQQIPERRQTCYGFHFGQKLDYSLFRLQFFSEILMKLWKTLLYISEGTFRDFSSLFLPR